MDRAPARSLVAELIGTFALVLAGAGAIMVDAKSNALGHLGVALTFGLVIMAMIYALGHVSGTHFNPAVSFAFASTRHFPWTRRGVLGCAASRVHSRRRRSLVGRLAPLRTWAPRCRAAHKVRRSCGS
jgi:hypothetical protein